MGKKIKIKDIIIKESIIAEDLSTQKEMEMLTEDVFKIYMKELIQNKIIVVKYGKYPSAWVFNKLEKGKYKTLNDFITNYSIDFAFITKMAARGAFKEISETTGAIRILYDIDKVIYELKDLDYSQSMDEQIKDLYYALRREEVLSTLLHELQHAYDYYRSKGKAIYNKKTDSYYNNANPSSEEYLNMKHEVMARVAQTFQRLDSEKHEDVRSYVEAFTKDFRGWNMMQEKNKKYLYRLASKHYHELEDKMKDDEKKKAEFDKKYNEMLKKRGE